MHKFYHLIRVLQASNTPISSDEKHQKNKCVQGDNEIELLKLKYEKLQYIDEKERERNKTIENKASMFIGSTSIMGAIIIGCANLVSNGSNNCSYVNICLLSYMLILIYCLGRSIIYSVLTLKKRRFWNLDVNDLKNTTNKKDHNKRLIGSTIAIIKHNESVINSKVDLMQTAQESFVNFWIWSGIFFVYLLFFHVFHTYGIGLPWDTLLKVLVTMVLSFIVFLLVKNRVEKLIEPDDKEAKPDVEDEIKAVCLMVISQIEGNDDSRKIR